MKPKLIISFLTLCLAIGSCTVTDLHPKEGTTDASYWRTVDDLMYYANGLYLVNPPVTYADNNSDNMLTYIYNSLLFDEVLPPTASGEMDWNWRNIRECNYFMKRYHTVTGSEHDINKYVAEVRFFRAQDYFDKIKAYGDVPWYETDIQTTDKDLLYKPRDPRGFVLTKIIEDLEFAIQWLPEQEVASQDRLHKDVARALLSRICLHEGTYRKYNKQVDDWTAEDLLRKAADQALTIMNTQRYEIVRGSDEGCGQQAYPDYPLYYSNQFIQDDLWGNKEAILAIRYIDGVSNFGNWVGSLALMPQQGLSKDLIESFLCKDGLPIGLSNLYQGDNTFEDELANRDPRLYQVVANPHKPLYVDEYGPVEIQGFPVNPWDAVTGYQFAKYMPARPEYLEWFQDMFDLFGFRYGETLLIYAEAKAELGECTQEVLDQTINLLRDRVDMAHLTVNPTPDPNPIDYGYPLSPLLYEIRRERRIELLGDLSRWDDIMRWNAVKLFQNPKTMLGIRITDEMIELDPTLDTKEVVELDGKLYLHVYPNKSIYDPARSWTSDDKRYLKPIPIEELTLNTNLKQNPGWSRQ